ncbi:hypothetical protein Tco_0242306 [Tanacetum coccineum]
MLVHYEMHHTIMGHKTTNRGLGAIGTTGLVVGQGLRKGNTTIPIRGDYLIIGLGIQTTTTAGLGGGSVATGSITVPDVIDDCMSSQRTYSSEDETEPPATHGTRSPTSKSLTKSLFKCDFVSLDYRLLSKKSAMDNSFTLGSTEEAENVKILQSYNGLLLCSGSGRLFVGAHAIFKPYRISDHSPSVLCLPTLCKEKPKPFKFFNVLTKHERFKEFVNEGWVNQISGFHMFNVVKKLKNLKKPIRKLLYEKGNLHANVSSLRSKLDSIRSLLDADPFNANLREAEASCVVEFNQAALMEEPYFHKTVKIRVSRSCIDTITNAEGLVFVNEAVPNIFVSHYEMFLGLAGETQALFSMGDDKSPGLDGYTACFFKADWEVVADDVTNAICEFFRNGNLLKELNHTIIALIPRILHGFGFHARMIAWIMECVTTTSYSICVNGSLHGYFCGKRGLRQGDPLSPYLFTLVMEVLTLMLQRRVHESEVFIYHRFYSKLDLINLCFVDDLFLFAYGDVHSASIIKEALEEFKGASGLTPSLPKSTAYFYNVLNHVKLSILQILPFEEGKLPVKYLGVPLVSSRLLIRDYRFLELCTFMPGFCVYSAYRVLLNIEADHEGFFYGSLQLEDGVLMWRGRLLSSLKMRVLLSLKESLWVKWIHEYKFKGRSFWDILLRGNVSWGWRKILQLRPTIREFIWCNLGDGAATSLWFDKWCEMGPLANLISSRDIFRAGLSHTSKVKDIIQDGAWNWPQDLLSKYPFLSTCHVPLVVSRSDCMVWHNSQGVSKPFSVAQPDSHDHLFFECPFASEVWDRMKGLAGLDSSSPNIYAIITEEREEDSLLVINFSGKVVQYNLISKSLREIYDMGSNEVDDNHDELLQQSETEHNVYEFIPSFASV